ncbi:WcaF family extracellular polysaccharide biosynthesis acetyltransferase [Aquirufa ecclesiirivi]|uniref:WcaF family extracellular polysaccharide biosynthesis acetyltransferase n=1 Tax=Aquirufa ecclesiirivi TaxID=2715124 RepID=UPI00140A2FD8|nr:WcaF family extracellular polysaccharide biosynthesis acetyltransferase [Aquirufa ecclesiirivi]MCZ2472122.1 colanic acid biosynthesis acetyltransferase WcaF [Aquirufa ecclesiirivi]MDF0693830.1 WcaF family extracellular polysaccharide biosynthesis acetyltransferase [Aquirufa ecclesiirivi]NHC48508.1 colanic acid biosynthesis acetyltransferase WcaF [Aquirufa ecclesiirivi]
MKTDLSTFTGEGSPGFIAKVKYFIWLLFSNMFFLTNIPYPNILKVSILRYFGAKIGHHVVIKPWVKIKFPWKLTLGNYVWLGEEAWIDNISEIIIGNHVCISQGALLLTGNHDYKKSSFDLMTRGITLEDGVWVGAKSTVSGGVILKSHSVLTVGSFTSKDLAPFTINQGNPAQVVKHREIN